MGNIKKQRLNLMKDTLMFEFDGKFRYWFQKIKIQSSSNRRFKFDFIKSFIFMCCSNKKKIQSPQPVAAKSLIP